MIIAVFNFNNDSVDIVSVDKEYINMMYAGDIENYLSEDLQYNPDDIEFMSDVRAINFADSNILNQVR